MKNSIGLLSAFVGGAFIGGIFGILFAPKSGELTSNKIVDSLDKRGIKLSKKEMNDLVDEIKTDVSND